jgi:hypothetical protein
VDADFPADRADAICARHARCDTLEIAGFVSEEACRDALHDAVSALRARYGLSCETWDADAAAACLAAYEGSCETAPDLDPCTTVCGG